MYRVNYYYLTNFKCRLFSLSFRPGRIRLTVWSSCSALWTEEALKKSHSISPEWPNQRITSQNLSLAPSILCSLKKKKKKQHQITIKWQNFLLVYRITSFNIPHTIWYVDFPWRYNRFDQHAYSEITQRDIRDFEHTWKVPILKIRNVPDTETKNDINEISQILTTICEHLWHRDIVLAGRSVPTSDGKISACWGCLSGSLLITYEEFTFILLVLSLGKLFIYRICVL